MTLHKLRNFWNFVVYFLIHNQIMIMVVCQLKSLTDKTKIPTLPHIIIMQRFYFNQHFKFANRRRGGCNRGIEYRNIGIKNSKYRISAMKRSQISEYRNEKLRISEYRKPIAPPEEHIFADKTVVTTKRRETCSSTADRRLHNSHIHVHV